MATGARKTIALLLAGTLLCACAGGGDSGGSGDGGAAEDQREAVDAGADRGTTDLDPYTGDDFYAVPDPLPEGEHGDLIRYQALEDGAPAGATTWRVMYLSEALSGDPIAVTGTVTVPDADPPEGGRDLVTVAHGTTGIADECAPSATARPTDGALAGLGVDRGYLMATTDYEGLGTPGRHPYLVGESEGRGVLDAAIAATQLPGADASGRLAVAGYSQGGHGALWAGQLVEEWAPQFELVGTFAGAPATELPVILSAGGSPGVAGFLFMIIAGFEAAYPDRADPSLLLTPAGLEALDTVDQGCVADVLGRVGELAGGDLMVPEPGAVEPWASLMAENDPGQVAVDAPVLIIHSAADDVVPAALSELLFTRMCGLGQQVERRVYDTGQGHGEAAPQAFVDAFDWIEARFAGEPASSTCA